MLNFAGGGARSSLLLTCASADVEASPSTRPLSVSTVTLQRRSRIAEGTCTSVFDGSARTR
eukprot:5448020-Alexandrium_andersonii.AAC.1